MAEMDPRVENLIGSLRDTGFIIREPNRSGSLTFTAQDPDGIGSVKIPGAEMTEAAWHNLLVKLEREIGWTPELIVQKRAKATWERIKQSHRAQRAVDPKNYDDRYERMRDVAEAEIDDSRMAVKDIVVDAQFAFSALTKHQIAAEWRGVADGIALDVKKMLTDEVDFVKQRKLSGDRAADLGQVMWDCRWMLTHQGPGIAPDGYIIDGQHRFEAVLRTNAVAAMRITYELPNKTFAVIDTGKPRTPGDALASLGIKSAAQVAATIRLHHFYDEHPNDLSKWFNRRITNDEITQMLINQYLDLPDSYRLAARVCTGRDAIIKSKPAVAVTHHAALRRWPDGAELAEEFWEVVRTGETGNYDGTHPAIRYRNWAVRWLGRTNTLGNKKGRFSIENLQIALRCWNAFVEGRDPGKMSFDKRWGTPQPLRPKGRVA